MMVRANSGWRSLPFKACDEMQIVNPHDYTVPAGIVTKNTKHFEKGENVRISSTYDDFYVAYREKSYKNVARPKARRKYQLPKQFIIPCGVAIFPKCVFVPIDYGKTFVAVPNSSSAIHSFVEKRRDCDMMWFGSQLVIAVPDEHTAAIFMLECA